jgi:DNA repair protein RecN (Recombination protein N)
MLKSLRVRNLATIEDLEVGFEPGFSVLTGETGAGKSILIDAIRLLLGEKGASDLIRTGRREAVVEGVFLASGDAPWPEDFGPSENGEILVQRQLNDQGAGKAYLNGVLVPVRRLREAGLLLADVYGQNDHVFLLHLENHLAYLDAYAEAESLRAETGRAARVLKTLAVEKRDLDDRRRERQQRLDFLIYQVKEIEAAGLRAGEEEDLVRERAVRKNAEKIGLLIEEALALSYLDQEAVLPRLKRLRHVLDQLAPFLPDLREQAEGLEPLAIALRELADGLREFQGRQAEAPDDLETIEARLALLEKLKRKYGATVGEVLEHLEGARTEAKELATGDERLTALDGEIARAFAAYIELTARLSRQRKKAAAALEKAVEEEIGLLGMKKARFAVRIESATPRLEDAATAAEGGTDQAEFLLSPNPGEELRPLRRIASGGELSRIMLALKAAGKERERLKTLIFDEIDAGIGGRTAECIAAKLHALAARHQVLCITHLPQIAAAAGHHYRIDKSIEKGRTFTTVARLEPGERAEEIARLIAGSRITEATLRIARDMMETAGPAPERRDGR